MGYPNSQANPAGAIPVWVVAGSIPPGNALLGYEQFTDLSSALDLADEAPEGAAYALVQVNDGIVRYRQDGVAPTGGIGMLMYATGPAQLFPLSRLPEFIQATGSTASLNVEFYGVA